MLLWQYLVWESGIIAWNIWRIQDKTQINKLFMVYFAIDCSIGSIVQLRSRSGRSEIDLSLTLFLVFTAHQPPHKLFSWLLRGLDISDGPRMGWYDSSRA